VLVLLGTRVLEGPFPCSACISAFHALCGGPSQLAAESIDPPQQQRLAEAAPYYYY
jgi:hypothetical protein